MGLTVLDNQFRIKIANDDFLSVLLKPSVKFKKGKVLFQIFKDKKLEYFYSTTDIHVLKNLGFWFSHITYENRSLFVFGNGEPKKTGPNIPICNVDFLILGNNRNSSAVFAQDEHGNVSALYRVNPDNLSLRSFELEFGGDWISAQEDGRNNYFILMGNLNQNFLETFKEFLIEFESISNLKEEPSKEDQNTLTGQKDSKSCLMCGNIIESVKSDYIEVLKSFDIDNSSYCVTCLEKIAAVYALKKIQKKINLNVFNKRSLLERVEDNVLFESYLSLLLKLGYLKEIQKDLLVLDKKEDIDTLINEYEEKCEIASEPIQEPKKCSKCGVVLSKKNSYKSDSIPNSLSKMCKDCSRKIYAVKALNHLEEYVDPGVPFNKDDLLKQVDSKTRFLDYIWTLEEFDLLETDEGTNFYFLKPEEDLIKFKEKYGDGIEETKTVSRDSSKTEEKKSVKKITKECEICKKVLPISKYYTDPTSEDGFMSKCKDCSGKSYAAKALSEFKKYVDPEIEFHKEDLLNQTDNRTQFLDYFWKLQEFDFIKHNEKADTYILTPDNKINSFIQQYGDQIKSQIAEKEEITPEKKIVKKCKTCEKLLPTSKFYKSSESKDGYTENCKKCSDNINAANILSEIGKYIGIGNSFSKKELSEQLGNPTKVDYYIWILQEHDLIYHNQKNDTYVIEERSNYQIYENILKKLRITTSSNDFSDSTDLKSTDIKEKLVIKEIIHCSKSIEVLDKKNLILMGLVSKNKLYSILEELQDIIILNMVNMSFNKKDGDLIKFILELEIKNSSFGKTMKLLEENDWKMC